MAPAASSTTTDSSTPYQKGARFRIQSHVPPEPFGGPYRFDPRPASALPDDVPSLRVRFALENPPLQTAPPPSVTEHTFTITATKTLRRVGVDQGGPHVVTGYLDQDEAVPYVAKIYDGLSYPLENEDTGEDFMTLADRDYAVEAWAYQTMLSAPGIVGRIVPGYHGAWTFSLDTHVPGRRRWVRMVLLQLVPGETVFDKILRASKDDTTLRYHLLPDENFRLRVLKQALEAETSIWWDGEVTHGDLEPRNVVVQSDGSAVIIDFNRAAISRFKRHGSHPKYFKDAPHLPLSPISRHWPWSAGGVSFTATEEQDGAWARWIPQSWLGNTELAAEWMLRTWGNPPPNKYRPLNDYFLNSPAHKERGPRVIAMLEKLGRKPAEKE